MPSSPSDRVGLLFVELRRYVVAHPRAADTLTGVARWWLPGHLAPTVLHSEVDEALLRLADLGMIERRELPDGSVLYVARAP